MGTNEANPTRKYYSKLETSPTVRNNEQQCPTDGGWGWVVCLGAFVVNFLTVGQQNSAGVVHSILVDEYKSNRGDTAWVTSLASSTMYLFAPLSMGLSEQYGSRAIVITGALISALGLLASSFAKTIPLLYFTYGVLWGLGASFGLFPSIVILSRYFNKRLALVTGIALSGAAAGSLIYGPMMQVLSVRYGMAGTFWGLGALQVFMLLSGLVYRPLPKEWESHPKFRKAYDWSVFRKRAYIVWVVALSTFMLVFLVPFVHMVRLAVDMGASKTKASFLTSFLATGIFIGSILFGQLADLRCCDKIIICQLGLMGVAISSTLVTMATSYEHVVAYALVFGFFDGCFEMIVPVITLEIVGKHRVGYAIGGLYCILAFPKTLGPPIAGWMYEISRSYAVAFHVTGGITIASVLIMFLVPHFIYSSKFQNTQMLSKCSKSKSSRSSIDHTGSVGVSTPTGSTCEQKIGAVILGEQTPYNEGSWQQKQLIIVPDYEYLVVEKLTCV